MAGQRVQVIKKDKKVGGVLEFGTEMVTAADGSLAALLGASPGASTSVSIMLELINRCFPDARTPAWQDQFKSFIPSYGKSLAKNAELAKKTRLRTTEVLQLSASRLEEGYGRGHLDGIGQIGPVVGQGRMARRRRRPVGGDDDPPARAQELVGHRPPEAAGAAGDERRPVGIVHRFTPSIARPTAGLAPGRPIVVGFAFAVIKPPQGEPTHDHRASDPRLGAGSRRRRLVASTLRPRAGRPLRIRRGSGRGPCATLGRPRRRGRRILGVLRQHGRPAGPACVHGSRRRRCPPGGVLPSGPSLRAAVGLARSGPRRTARLLGHPPFMFRPAGGTAPDPPPHLEIRPVVDAAGLAEFAATIMAAFSMAPDEGLPLTDPRILGGPLHLFTGYVEGRPVATSGGRVGHGIVDIEWVSCLEEARGAGVGAALTWAATMVAPDLPATLIASDDGRPVYARMGFLSLLRMTMWHRPPTDS